MFFRQEDGTHVDDDGEPASKEWEERLGKGYGYTTQTWRDGELVESEPSGYTEPPKTAEALLQARILYLGHLLAIRVAELRRGQKP